VIKYIGSKRELLPWIGETIATIRQHADIATAADPFTGTTRVAQMMKRLGLHVAASDLGACPVVLARAYIETDATDYPPAVVQPLLEALEATPPAYGYFTRTFCEEARYIHPDNGRRIEAIRRAIPEAAGGDPHLEAILLTSLVLAADRVDSTVGVQMAYLKSWAARSLRPLELRMPDLITGTGTATHGDAAAVLASVEADLLYLDPPYNQHCYRSNYHVWETLVRGDEPETYGIANKRVDCKENRSPFNSKRRAADAFADVVNASSSPHALVSYSNEGFIPANQMVAALSSRWPHVLRLGRTHRRYIGAQIGIYDLKGEKVGTPGKRANREWLFVATSSQTVADALQEQHEALE
jgi:adenine-specific DNA-methyltransferase